MFRRLIVLGLVVALVSALATVAAVQSSEDDAEAQVSAFQMNQLCLEITTKLYKGSFTPNCPPNHQLLVLPDAYPLTLCASAYDGFLRAPLFNGDCPPATIHRIDLPSESQVTVCYYYFTGRLGLPSPYPNGTCSGASFLVTFPTGFDGVEDTYQTLGNVDLDVPASDGLLSNDTGSGLMVTAFDAVGTNGGAINVNPDGSFTYIPPAPNPNAFTGDDTFTYDVEDNGGMSETVTVTIEILNPVVWFVDIDAQINGDGRRETPFNDIEIVNDDGNDPDEPGDFIFLFESPATYNANFQLEMGQYLVGQEVDLAEILQDAIEGTQLMGLDAEMLPPFIVTPAEDPSGNSSVLRIEGIALTMADDSTAVGLTITSDADVAVLVSGVENATLDRVVVFGGIDGNGQPGVVVQSGDVTIIDSEIVGGAGGTGAPFTQPGSALQGLSDPGDGGHAIYSFLGSVTVLGSNVAGGHGGAGPTPFNDSSALHGIPGAGGNGGFGIFIEDAAQVTVDNASEIFGGNGGIGSFAGGNGGHGIGTLELFSNGVGATRSNGRNLQGGGGPGASSFIDVLGASLVAGGFGGDGGLGGFGGFGGDGIAAGFLVTSVTEGSTVQGGDAGNGSVIAGDGGFGIFLGGLPLRITGSALQGTDPPLAILTVDASTVEGGAGGNGNTGGGWGGDGILAFLSDPFTIPDPSSSLQGGFSEAVMIDITDSTVTGGHGGSSIDDFGGDGGWGITIELDDGGCCNGAPDLQGPGQPDLQLDLNVTNSDVFGGAGGFGDFAGGFGGVGIANGYPIFFNEPLSATEPRRVTLQGPGLPFVVGGNLTVIDSAVEAGPGGSSEDFGGDGGVGIFSVGPDFFGDIGDSNLQGNGSPAMTTISNSVVLGAAGGEGSDGGFGGDAFAIFGIDLLVDQNTNATAGEGADADEDDGGDGGFGIYAEESTIVVDGSIINAADGGDNVEEGDDGLGGEGIYGFDVNLTVQNGSQVTGGNGGGAETGHVPGGDGIFAEDSNVTVTGSTVTGGTGSFGDGTQGGNGGHGVHVAPCFFCNTLTVTNSTINGGDGGGSATDESGHGGEGIIVEDDNATITGSTVTGGDAGSGGSGAPAIAGVIGDDGDYGLVVQNNTLTAGTGGAGTEVSLIVANTGPGSVCIDVSGNMWNSDFDIGNIATGVLGITQPSIAAMEAANNNVTVNATGTITFDCVVMQN